MIFVTVGTHEQQFNRLITCVDEMKENGLIKEEVMIQTGFSTYIQNHVSGKKCYPTMKARLHSESKTCYNTWWTIQFCSTFTDW